MMTLSKILVPHDFGEVSDRALDFALEMAAKFDAEITVLHAYQLAHYGYPDSSLMATDTVEERLTAGVTKHMDDIVQARAGRGVKLTGVCRVGLPVEQVNAVAEEIGADLIVVGTHGRKGVTRALLGSIAEQIIRASPRPVLTIHGVHR
jgi:nucleotide-binding universal stress UspA family protein